MSSKGNGCTSAKRYIHNFNIVDSKFKAEKVPPCSILSQSYKVLTALHILQVVSHQPQMDKFVHMSVEHVHPCSGVEICKFPSKLVESTK